MLRGLDLTVAHGERVAVLGPNGAGKTTLMLHLNGLLRGAGELEVAGLPVGPDTLPALRARVGLVFQDPDDQLFMPTVADDVGFGPRNLGLDEAEVTARTAAALAAVRMEHAAARAPHQLSMGERRRVAIAGVLAMDPRLLVLDEPSANLDPRARRELLDLLARARPHAARRHARPAVRRRAVRARGDPLRRPDRRRRPVARDAGRRRAARPPRPRAAGRLRPARVTRRPRAGSVR